MAIIGWDVGQAEGGDPSALAIIGATGRTRPHTNWPVWRLAHLQRLAGGLTLREQARQVAAIGTALQERGEPVLFGVDSTGIGTGAVEFLREEAAALVVGITWTAGATVHDAKFPDLTVPKHLMVAHLEMALEQQAIEISPGLADAPALASELAAYWRDGRGRTNARTGHDDQVAALVMAVWLGDFIAERTTAPERT